MALVCISNAARSDLFSNNMSILEKYREESGRARKVSDQPTKVGRATTTDES